MLRFILNNGSEFVIDINTEDEDRSFTFDTQTGYAFFTSHGEPVVIHVGSGASVWDADGMCIEFTEDGVDAQEAS